MHLQFRAFIQVEIGAKNWIKIVNLVDYTRNNSLMHFLKCIH